MIIAGMNVASFPVSPPGNEASMNGGGQLCDMCIDTSEFRRKIFKSQHPWLMMMQYTCQHDKRTR